MLNLNSIMIGTSSPEELIKFYEKVFGKPADWSEEGWNGWQVGSTNFMLGEHSEVKGHAKDPKRTMFNLETKEINEEFGRIKKIGATVIKEPDKMEGGTIATFADPDGNYFQLITPWEQK